MTRESKVQKSINLHTIRKLIEYSLKYVLEKAMVYSLRSWVGIFTRPAGYWERTG